MKKVLFIEDDSDISDVLATALREAGYDVLQLPRAWSIAEIAAIAADIILLDHFISGELGGDMCIRLKKHPRTVHIRVVLTSVLSNVEEIAVASCADRYIRKPFGIWEAEETMRTLVHKSASDPVATIPFLNKFPIYWTPAACALLSVTKTLAILMLWYLFCKTLESQERIDIDNTTTSVCSME